MALVWEAVGDWVSLEAVGLWRLVQLLTGDCMCCSTKMYVAGFHGHQTLASVPLTMMDSVP